MKGGDDINDDTPVEDDDNEDKHLHHNANKTINEYVGVNILSVVVGAMMFLSASAWIDFVRALTEEIYDNMGRNSEIKTRRSFRRFVSAVCITVVSVILLIICYSWYKRKLLERKITYIKE